MANLFSNISSTINRTNSTINNAFSNAGSIGTITGRINQGAANVQRLASQAGNIDIYASQLTNGFSQIGDAVNDLTSAGSNLLSEVPGFSNLADTGADLLSGISGFSNFNANSALDQIKNLGNIGNLVSPDQLNSILSDATGTLGSVAGQLPLTELPSIEELNSLIGEFNIEEFATNTIQVLPRDAAELRGAVGGVFDTLRQNVESIGDASGLDEYLQSVTNSAWDSNLVSGAEITASNREGLSRSKIPNPLRNHNSFNYILTLGALSQNENNFPEIYRNRGGFETYVIKSSGGNYNKRYQVLDELGDQSGVGAGHAEYYIDNLEIDAAIAPNPNTTITPGSVIKFTVHEPYSMGNFVQAIVGSAQQQGFPNAIRAPFCLKIDFVGYNEDGQQPANFIGRPMFIPIQIYNMSFNVTEAGSVYTVEAVSASEAGLSDAVNEIKTTVNAVGTTVYDVLNGEDRSLTAALNQRIATLEEEDVLSRGDRFIIAFPKDLNGMKNALSGVAPGVAEELTQAEQTRRERGLSTRPDDGLRGGTNVEQIVVQPSSQLFDIIDIYSRDTSKMNEIGLSIITEDTAEGGDHAQANPSETYNDQGDVNRGSPDAAVAEKAREHKFNQGERITQAIEKVILRSRYAAEHATEESNANGTRQWFKIETQVYIDSIAESEAETGQPAKVYVYNVIPYFPDEAKFLGTQERPANTQQLMAAAVKEYNYIYTGLNEDVLEFDLTFNQAFQQTVMANYGQNSGASGSLADVSHNSGSDTNSGAGTNRNSNDSQNSEPGATIQEQAELSSGTYGGGRSQDIKLRVAEMFHDRLINQIADLVTAEMKIFGDPYWMIQQTGNYVGESASPNLTEDGTVNYMTNEVFVVINFKTPFDYQVEGATMEMPKVVPGFSGLFSCWSVTSTFSGGKFEQTLKLTRRRGQDDEPTTGNQGLVDVSDDRSITDEQPPQNGDDQAAQSNANNTVTSTTGSSDPCETTETVQINEAYVPSEDNIYTPTLSSEQSTTSGNNVTFQPSTVQVGPVTYDPRTGVFPANSRRSLPDGNVDLGFSSEVADEEGAANWSAAYRQRLIDDEGNRDF